MSSEIMPTDGERKSSSNVSVPWVEKYRPRSIDDVAHQDEVVSVLRKCLQGADLPNFLFYGPPGTGKTSTILAAARHLYGSDIYRSRVLELNASDDRGIQVIREKIKTFAQLSVANQRPDGTPCPPFKIIILDEADSMTHAAQAALRRTMEKYSKTTRFCLICNYVSRIIEPLTSRCSKFRFKPLPENILLHHLSAISEKENLDCDKQALRNIISISEGDMRKAITYIQSVSRLYNDKRITSERIIESAGVIPDALIDSILETCRLNSYEKLDKIIQNIIADSYSAYQLLSQLHDKIVDADELSDKKKSFLAQMMAEIDKCLMDGADEYLQMMKLCSHIMQQVCAGE
ncbi:Replication factor C subunit 4 [Trichoplax sp. H2]|nr:Replication factor C subunit 4 [Trichoplax sp. H2]|eukprot:RDD46100.1 Replication factor C subunit 4 [Trichoplax sp. H2]